MILVYLKSTDDTGCFEKALNALPEGAMAVLTESRRSFEALDEYPLADGDILVVSSMPSLGRTEPEAAARINRLISSGVITVLCSHPATYEYGISKPVNHAALSAIIQSSASVTAFPGHSGAGRPKLSFPDGWEELYDLWSKKEITSAEFIERSGLKRASFYNMLAEYKSLLHEADEFVKKYG